MSNKPAPHSRAWNVYLGRRLIDTVTYDADCTAEYVRRGLVEHDGYDAGIRVALRRAKRAPKPAAPVSNVAKAVELLERYGAEVRAGRRDGGTMGGVSLAMDAALAALHDVEELASTSARLLDRAQNGLDQTATAGGLLNCAAIAAARGALAKVSP